MVNNSTRHGIFAFYVLVGISLICWPKHHPPMPLVLHIIPVPEWPGIQQRSLKNQHSQNCSLFFKFFLRRKGHLTNKKIHKAIGTLTVKPWHFTEVKCSFLSIFTCHFNVKADTLKYNSCYAVIHSFASQYYS